MVHVTVWEWERGVRFRRGAFVDELGPGRYRQAKDEHIRRVETRANTYTLAGQEVPTQDDVHVRVSLAVRWAITDATAYVRAAANPQDELHTAAQLALRSALLTRAHTDLNPRRADIVTEIAADLATRAAEVGVTVHSVAIRDIALPVELRRAALAELVARKEGAAALEHARAESAALRALLNAARLAEEHPALLQLRTLQAAARPGTTVVFERPGR
jgi:regulator of protease activity HflC (stomatin/prohibitin superfamily)